MYMFFDLNSSIKEYLFWKSSYTLTATDRYATRLNHFEAYIGKEKSIADITTSNIIAFHMHMENDSLYSRATVAYSARVLKNFFEFWKGRGLQVLNPKEIKPPKYIHPDKKLISEDEFEQMNDVLGENSFEDLVRKLTINLLWDTGMRVSELCDMDIADIEETEHLGMRCARIRRRKSLRYNTIVWGTETNRLLNLYLGLRLSMDRQTDALLLNRQTKMGKRITTRCIQRWVRQISQMTLIGGKTITPHSFRHTKANRILDKSGNVRDVQAILGHVSPISSFNYLNLNRERHVSLSQKYLE